MPSSLPALAAAFAALSYASPIESIAPVKPRIGFTFSANLTLSPNSKNLNPALSLAWPYAKYNVPMPADIKAAAINQTAVVKAAAAGSKASGLTGTTVTVPEPYDVEYLVPVDVGGTSMNLVLDSGSSDLWVFSDLMSTTQLAGHSYYKTSASKLQQGQAFYIKYGDGSHSEGKVYTDKVTIAGLTVNSQAVEAATTVSQSFLNHVDADGLLGLSMTALNTIRPTQQKTFFDNIKSSLAKPYYTVTLKQQAVGSIDFGYLDFSKFTGPLNHIQVNPPNAAFWQFYMRRYAIAGKDQPVIPDFVAIVDTGTSLTYLPSAIINNYYSRVKGSGYDTTWGGYTFPCTSDLPWMGLYINGVKYPIPPKLINWERINATHCLGGLQSSDRLPFAILGDVFLKTVFVIFDAVQSVPRVGFAAQA